MGEVIEGVIVTPRMGVYPPSTLAEAFVECVTEYDFHELPTELQVALIVWCRDFQVWARTEDT